MLSENRSWSDLHTRKNHIRSDFVRSDSLIDTVTIIWAVGYNSDSTSFTTNLTSLRIGITIITMNLTSLKIRITIIATNSYDISELELQALREIVTISKSWNYKYCYKYLQCLIVRITIIARNNYNISDYKQSIVSLGW
jgi:3-methyladenine DNA glycosylase AlkD